MELQFTSNFCMLTEHLHLLFKRYISDGRVRAPPEFELTDLIPTFQHGAKTHRRALQSKFKSWAKRMALLNGNLVLSRSGKIIIPQERCEEVVMELHSENHLSINKVIYQIQRRYSWTKKNFGMDEEVVMNVVSKNCKNATCRKDIRKFNRRYFKKLIHWVPASNFPQHIYEDSSTKYAEFYDPMGISPNDERIGCPILQSFLSSKKHNTLEVFPASIGNRTSHLKKFHTNENYNDIALARDNKHFKELYETDVTEHTSPGSNIVISDECTVFQSVTFTENQNNKSRALRLTLNSGKNKCLPTSIDIRDENEFEKVNLSRPISIPSAALLKVNQNFTMENKDTSRYKGLFTRSCIRPRNCHEFKKQLKDAQMYPKIYPNIFTDPQTQFLSTLGLVPKKICSKRMLTKFDKEQRKKSFMEKRRSWFTGERKVLRDRNKLNKRSSLRLKMRHETYGSLNKHHVSSFYHSFSPNSQKTRNYNVKKLKNISKQPLRGHIENPKMIKQKLILPQKCPATTKNDPEIIDIASSDEESPEFKKFIDAKQEVPEPQVQPSNSCEQNMSYQYPDPRLFRCNADNEEAMRNQMFYEQNFGYNGVFGAPNFFFCQNNVVNYPVTGSSPPYLFNDSFYLNPQTQFPIWRPFFIPAVSNNDIAGVQPGSFPTRPIDSPNVSPFFKDLQPLPMRTNSSQGEPGHSKADEQCLYTSNGNATNDNKERNTNSNSDIVVMQPGGFPIIRPLTPTHSPNISPIFNDLQTLPKSTNSFQEESRNAADEEKCLFTTSNGSAVENKESSVTVNPVSIQASQPPSSDVKVFVVNKIDKKTFLIVPPNCSYLNTAKKIVPILDRKRPIAPRMNCSEKMPVKFNSVTRNLQHGQLNNTLFANVNYNGKQKESKKDVQSEMARLSNWISKIKSTVTPANFHRGVDRFSQRLSNQLNIGITLVKGIRNTLIEIEKTAENIAEDAV